jgi:putative component of toxin-antitoxin plasmid stabilization module
MTVFKFALRYDGYYALSGAQIVLLFSGGTKGTQAADIDRACAYWKIFQEQR